MISAERYGFAAVASIVVMGVLAPPLLGSTPEPRNLAPPQLVGGPPEAGKDRLALAIKNRIGRAGLDSLPMPASAGYFDRNPVLPDSAFYAYAGKKTPFRFTVLAYKTTAQAVTMYGYYYQHVLDIGGNFHAFKMIRLGRVIYMASTAAAPDPNAPAVPMSDFLSLIALASGRL